MKRLVLTTFSALVLVAPFAHAELVTNGGFESGDFAGWTCGPAACGSSDQANVYFSGVSSAFPANGTYSYLSGASTYGGTDGQDITQPIYATIAQTLSTVAGQQYLVTFNYGEYNSNQTLYNPNIQSESFDCSFSGAGCYDDPANIDYNSKAIGDSNPSNNIFTNIFYQYNYLGALIDGSTVFSDDNFLAIQQGLNQQGQGFYQPGSVMFTATSNSTTLEFDTFDIQAGVVLDDVSVTEVTPEPGTFLLLGGGLLASLIGKRRLSRTSKTNV